MNAHLLIQHEMPRTKISTWLKPLLLQVLIVTALLSGQLLLEIVIAKEFLQRHSELKKLFPEWKQ